MLPFYGILKHILVGWLDLFLILFFFICYYKGWLVYEIFIFVIKFLGLLYFYKIYHFIFKRFDYDRKLYEFSWTFPRLEKLFEKYCMNISFYKKFRIVTMLMPWNLLWIVLINIVGYWRLLKVWFNGNKDILIIKWFGIDIREPFDRYIMWYYKWINPVIEFFIHKPLLRIIVLPSIIRNAIINASIFGLFKAIMFVFIFFSLLSMNKLTLYGNLTWEHILFVEYIYFLIIWPIITKFFKFDKFYFNYEYNSGIVLGYATPYDVYNAWIVSERSSISLSLFFTFQIKLQEKNFDKKYETFIENAFWPSWMNVLMKIIVLVKDLEISGIDLNVWVLFWRYEKVYTSFLVLFFSCIQTFVKYVTIAFIWIEKGFVPLYMSKEQISRIYEIIKVLYLEGWYGLFDIWWWSPWVSSDFPFTSVFPKKYDEKTNNFILYRYNPHINFLKKAKKLNSINIGWNTQTLFLGLYVYKQKLFVINFFFEFNIRKIQNLELNEFMSWIVWYIDAIKNDIKAIENLYTVNEPKARLFMMATCLVTYNMLNFDIILKEILKLHADFSKLVIKEDKYNHDMINTKKKLIDIIKYL